MEVDGFTLDEIVTAVTWTAEEGVQIGPDEFDEFAISVGPLPEPGFVYVTLTRAEADRFRTLPALQEMVVHVKIRAPRTRYLTTPVVELESVVSGLPQ